jgi:capping protein (actin filament) muscle Z-line, alpha
MHGSIKVNNHFFENGNVQFNLDKKYEPVQLKGSDGVSICEKINELETAYQLSVDEVLEMTKEGMMKKMRRTIPVSGQKFDWDKPKMML